MVTVYRLKNIASRYAMVFCRFLDDEGIEEDAEFEFNLYKDALESVVSLYRVKQFNPLRNKLVRLLKREIKLGKLVVEDKVAVVDFCLAYYVAGSYLGGDNMYYLKVKGYNRNSEPIEFVVGSKLSIDRVTTVLESLFDLEHEYEKVEAPEDKWLLVCSINNSKLEYAGLCGRLYIESSDGELVRSLKEALNIE